MRQTINISLAGIAFSIETEGYNKLKSYLSSIQMEYDNPLEAAELTSDIETRIAELILNRQSNSTPVTEETIDSIIAQMGFPVDEESHKKPSPPIYEENRKIAHRLYRNPNGAMLGGVCSGLSAYFNMDVVIIRLLFFMPLIISIVMTIFVMGFFWNLNILISILYLILWIVIPKARSPRQILEMQGEPVTKENMERFLKDEMIDIDSNISRITRSEKSATLLSSLIYAIGRIIKFFLYLIGSLIILGICIAILVGIGYVIYGSVACDVYFTNLLSGNIYVNIAAAVIICVIPLIIFLMILIRPIFKVYPKKSFYITLTIIWLVAGIYGSVIGTKSYTRFAEKDYFTEDIEMPISGGTLYIKPLNPDIQYFGNNDLMHIDEDMMHYRRIYVSEPHNDSEEEETEKKNSVKIHLCKTTFGKTNKEAYENGRKAPIEYIIEGDTLFIDNHFKANSPNEILNESSVYIHKPSHLKYYNKLAEEYNRYR